MDELKENILLKNKCHILRMNNNKKKVDMLEAYFALLNCYRILKNDEDIDEKFLIDADFAQKYYRYVYANTEKRIMDLIDNAEKLYNKFQIIVDSYKENDFYLYRHINLNKVHKDEMEDALFGFFDYLGSDVSKIYYDMIMGGNIFLKSGNMERLGYAVDSTPIDNACITVQNIPNYLDFYITIAHEIGHCYQFHLQRNQRNYSMLDPYCEVTSILFEKLFIKYLKDNYLIKDDEEIKLENHITFLNEIVLSKYICKLFKEDKIGLINPYNLAYTCSVKKEEMEKEITDDCGWIIPDVKEPELIELRYAFGDIIAAYFYEKLKEDFELGWQEFKNFICTVNYLPLDEVIDKYFDIELVKSDIKTLMKSYR